MHQYKPTVSHVIIRLQNAHTDACPDGCTDRKLEIPGNNGRKIFATSVMPQKGEIVIDNETWSAPAVYPTGDGGIEIANVTEFCSQDRHMHNRATEIYTVLKGQLGLFINDKEIPVLNEGDEIVVLPGTVHQVCKPSCSLEKKESFDLLVRVHSICCYGEDDKYVQLEQGGEWVKWSTLTPELRVNAYKL
jgi:mannose-6-phosphate isomerase-like protein (cupin superfamily)